jgi:hypothetical protein
MSAVAAALGGVLYVLLTWVASWVYQPAGVRPSEVGLGYVPLLAGTAVTLVVALAVVLAAVAVAFGAAWLRNKKTWAFALAIIALLALVSVSWSINEDAGFFLGFLPVAVFIITFWPKYAYKVIAILATILVLAVAGSSVWESASEARRNIQNVTSTLPIGVFDNPWEGQIALVQRIGSTRARCGLYLGESNGTGVLVYKSTEPFKRLRTIRLPLSSVLIEIIPDQVVC